MTIRLIERLQEHARESPGACAIRHAVPVTREQLIRWTFSLANRLSKALKPGGVVLLCTPNQPEFIAAFLAILAAGLKAFPLSPELAPPELLDAADRTGAVALIGNEASINILGARVSLSIPIDDVSQTVESIDAVTNVTDAAGLMLLSSGTTGRPKIVFRDAASLDAVSESMVEAIGFRESDRVLACVPLCHSYGIEHGLLAPLWAGSCVHLAQGFDLRNVSRELSESKISILPGVPFMFEMLMRHTREGVTFPSLRIAYSAGGPLPRPIADSFSKRFGIAASQLYGATEIGSVTYSNPAPHGFDSASVGRAMKGVSIRIVATESIDRMLSTGEEGQVAVSATSMLQGYFDEPDPPMIDGHFLTGDLGRLDEFGNLTVTGRIKLLIDVGGLKVNPLEVEEVLAQHSGVASCIVLPLRVSETVCRLKAIVTPVGNNATLSPESLRKFARERLAGYKVPRLFEVRDQLPKSPTGKILRHLVEA